ncbi:MAG TPA: Rne/Rng family ribonuclease [Terriglobales bacterium]|jgi:ribonuclease G|nr:Rne/Rng family ribonuclease [Terriglobales bacterium]
MTKELFVSSTPHETKVGLVEDDLLAEIYLERENEYTLAGSIYKGRVTRVLPGMQSAFVDIGLERDAFLYVSDFMELEDAEDLEEVPINRAAPERYQQQAHPSQTHQAPSPGEAPAQEAVVQPADEAQAQEYGESGRSEHRESSAQGEPENREGTRGRRRRRGRRGERFPESKFARPGVEAPREAPRAERTERTERPERYERPERQRQERSERPDRSEYGPPPGYQPIILPGESISKYQRLAQTKPASSSGTSHIPAPERAAPAISEIFAGDEPLFAEAVQDQAPGSHEQAAARSHEAQTETEPSDSSREQKRLHQMNVAEVFGGDETEEEEETDRRDVDGNRVAVGEHSEPAAAAVAGTVEEEEIEEEEADLAHYVEELEEDAAFEELEEETHAAGETAGEHEHVAQDIAASAEIAPVDAVPFSADAISSEEIDVAAAEEIDEEAEDEAELDEAQAEAEAALAAEAGGVGMTEARAEVRAPAGTAGYTQRAPRPGYDRRPQRGGRRGGGGRRFRRNEQQSMPLITDLLKEGQEILVQIAKEPIGKKGARITSHIALPGRFLVYMPTVNHTGVSRKIASEEERQRLKRIIQSERENGHGGFIVRTAAMNAAEEDLRADIRFLKGLWAEIKSRADAGKGPTLIYHDLNVVERVLRDQVTSDFSAIWVDSDEEYERILRFANRFQPALVKRVKLYTKETPLYEQFGLSEEINKALKSKVWLKSGGYIVINQTEALVAIDVNTGKYVGKTTRLEDTIVKTNVDAIKEIVRQIRLRDLGGIIVIDFIDMDERRNRQKVMQALEEALRGDRAPSKVLQFNDFGLVAITRKRVKQSLERTIGSPCPYCQSTGFVKSVTTVCNEIYLEMRKIAKHLEHADVMLRVNPEVAKTLKANNGKALIEMEEMTKKTVIVKSDPALHQEQFDIN